MREVDRRSKIDRRNFLKTAAAVPPAAAVAATTGVSISDAWADTAKALKPETLKTLAHVARDIYPHDHLADHYYITAVTPWDAKAAADPNVKALIEGGIALLDENARAHYKAPYAAVAWEEQRVALLREIEHSEFFGKVRGDLLVSLYNNHDVWPKFGYEGSSAERGGYINRGFDDINNGDLSVADEICADTLIEHEYLAPNARGADILKGQITDARSGVDGLQLSRLMQ